MLERNKHNGFLRLFSKLAIAKMPSKGAFLLFTVFPHGDFKSPCKSKNRLAQAVSCGAPSGTRTRDTLIQSQVLYQQS